MYQSIFLIFNFNFNFFGFKGLVKFSKKFDFFEFTLKTRKLASPPTLPQKIKYTGPIDVRFHVWLIDTLRVCDKEIHFTETPAQPDIFKSEIRPKVVKGQKLATSGRNKT
jgi:hypothetical protein